jgi:hypothetical protein
VPYKTWVDGTVLSAADMTAITKDPVEADVSTVQTTSSSTYTSLATAGPSVSVTLAVGQTCTVTVSADISVSNTAAGARASYAVSGAVTVAANDTECGASSNLDGTTCTKPSVFTCTSAGSHTFTMQYRSNGSIVGTFSSRRITAKVH